jgi:DNA-binding GntR family transcriptional regulator
MREKAYFHIQRKIAAGELPSGMAVSELFLAKEMGISRTPVREAIGQLVAEGLLDQIPNRGAIVVQLTRRDIIDLYELREALEVFAVGKIGEERIRQPDLDRLQQLTDAIPQYKAELERSGRTALNAEEMHHLVANDLSFHILLVRIAANPRILKIVNETRLLIRIFAMHRDGHTAPVLDEIHRQHCEVLRAVSAHDCDAAKRSLAAHIRASLQERLDEYDRWEREESLRAKMPIFFDLPSVLPLR